MTAAQRADLDAGLGTIESPDDELTPAQRNAALRRVLRSEGETRGGES